MTAGSRTALLAGAGGMLGRHLAALLRREEPQLRLAGLGRGAPRVEGVEPLACDLLDGPRLEAILRRLKPRWIFHLAGAPGGSDLGCLLRDHVSTTAALLGAVARARTGSRIVLVGSAAEYGRVPPSWMPVTEDTPLRPVTPYGAAKRAQIALGEAARGLGLDVVVARLFNVVGAGLSPSLSAASFARQVAEIEAGLRPAVLETGNLSPRRDFVDAGDAARALLLAARRGRGGRAYNICTGRSVSIREVLEALRRLARRPFEVRVADSRVRRSDIPDLRGSYARARRELGWRPTVPLVESLAAMLERCRDCAAGPPGAPGEERSGRLRQPGRPHPAGLSRRRRQ